jgi:hypothetical protein
MPLITKITTYNARLGEWPKAALPPAWFAQNPFTDTRNLAGLSSNLTLPQAGIVHGHNTMLDSNFWDGCFVNREVPLSPLFARDLAGRAIYLGYGPEIKDNDEWEAYQVPVGADGKIPEEKFNPFIPFIVFPRHCRDLELMEGAELLEEVLFCHFRPLEMATGYHVLPSGGNEDDEPLAPTYNGANLYPYKLRLDTFYPDGYRLPQTQMLFARGFAQGVNETKAEELGQNLLKSWNDREPGTKYEDWFNAKGEEEFESLFQRGCTIIPTFEAHNGVAVVGREFELEEFWPGRAVVGLHDVLEFRPDQAPRGTIVQVVAPGYITARSVVPAQVIVSDGSGYVSPNAQDPLPLVPNLNLPHSRTAPNWRGCHLPTHPQHFELPAIWGWEPESGKFLQLAGPLWAPLYYFYGCTDTIIDAYDFPEEWDAENPSLTPVPPSLKGRFWPIVPMPGFDTFNLEAREARREQGSKLRSILTRVETENPTAGVAYHPLPMEFEFECEPFWFPELHPLNRQQGLVPEDLTDRIVPVISPKVSPQQFMESVQGTDIFRGSWLKDPARMGLLHDDVLLCYPHLVRYLLEDLAIEEIMRLSPVPILSSLGDLLTKPATQWWANDDGTERDTPEALEQIAPGLHDILWDTREKGVELVKFRHMLYQTNLPLYILSYWYGASPELMQSMLENWIKESDPESAAAAEANATTTATSTTPGLTEDDLSPEEMAQLRAIEAMSATRERNRLIAEQASGMPEDAAPSRVIKTM